VKNSSRVASDCIYGNLLYGLREYKKHNPNRIAGGTVSGAVALDLIVNADSARGLDEVITSLPVWPLRETTITPLTMFNDRRQAVLAIRERLATQVREGGGAMR
jgi:hypothetical protein